MSIVYQTMLTIPPRIAVLSVGRADAADAAGLCARARALLARKDVAVLVCDVRHADPHPATVDALARLRLIARREGCRMRLRHARPELLELIGFMGLRDVLLG